MNTAFISHFALIGHVLNEFVRNCALPYLEDDHPEVRGAAAQTCCHLFMRDPICYQASNHSIEIISDVIDKLLTVGIADPGMYCILSYVAIGSCIYASCRLWNPAHCSVFVA